MTDGQKTYELAYLLSPLIAAEAIAEQVEKELKQPLSVAKAELKHEFGPRLMALAYPIKKVVEHKGSTFREAYFGSLVFTCEPAAIAAIEAKLKKSHFLIRHLLITVPATLPTPVATVPNEKGKEVGPEKMSTEAMDQEIAQLLV